MHKVGSRLNSRAVSYTLGSMGSLSSYTLKPTPEDVPKCMTSLAKPSLMSIIDVGFKPKSPTSRTTSTRASGLS